MRKLIKLIYNYVFRRVVAWHDGRICKKCLAIDIPETLRAIEIRHPGKKTETDRPCAYFDPRGCIVSTMPEHLNPMNKEYDGNR